MLDSVLCYFFKLIINKSSCSLFFALHGRVFGKIGMLNLQSISCYFEGWRV